MTYLASAYLVFLAVVLLYVVIVAAKLGRLRAELDAVRAGGPGRPEPARDAGA